MLYLSEINIDFSKTQRFVLFDSYKWHKFIWKFFSNKESRNFLFRVDNTNVGCRIYIISHSEPNPQSGENYVSIRTKEIPESFLERKRYFFKIRLNPVRTHVVRDPNTNERIKGGARLTVSPADLPVWINEKFLKSGMRILHSPELGLECEISPITKIYFKKNNNRAFHSSVDVSGILEVEDQEKFKLAFSNGIGHAKAFGFGLLILQ